MTACEIKFCEEQHPHPDARLDLGGATLIEACDYALELDPENENVKALIDDGIPGALDLDPECPDDVCTWLKTEGNTYGDDTKWIVIEGRIGAYIDHGLNACKQIYVRAVSIKILHNILLC